MSKKPQANLSISERFRNVAEKWYLLSPLYFLIWTTHTPVLNPNIKSIRVGSGMIEYNPEFIDDTDDVLLQKILENEMVRIILKHPYSRKKEIAEMSYLASNITLKEHSDSGLPFPTAEQIFGKEEAKKRHFEWYYEELMQNMEKQQNKSGEENEPQNSAGEKNQNSGQAGKQAKNQESQEEQQSNSSENEADTNEKNENSSSNSAQNQSEGENSDKNMPSPPQYEPQKTPLEDYCSSDSGRENTENWQYDEMKQTQINEKIEDIAQRNQWGNITNSLREQVLATLKPKMDYRAVLSAFRASILSQKRVLTRMKESRRYGFLYMGSRRDFATKLLVAVDVSGSMSSGMIAKGFSVINQFFRYGIERIDVMQFDCEIQGKIQKFQKAQAKINLIGRGGTNFQVVFDYIEKHRDYDGVIIFTDGDAYQPKRGNNRKTRIIWLLDTFDNYQKSLPYLSATGKCTYIRE